jgi:organic radical activating enzyme
MLIPKQIDIEVSSICNLRCVGCPCNTRMNTDSFMSFPKFKSIIDRINFPCTVVPWLNGEPMMNPEYGQMLWYLNDMKIPYYVTTNGHFWNIDAYNAITSPNSTCYQIIFSIDGLQDHVMIVARPGTRPDIVRQTLSRLKQIKKERECSFDIAVKFCQRGQDWGEFEDYLNHYLFVEPVDFVIEGWKMLGEQNSCNMRTHDCQYSSNNFMVVKSDCRLVMCAYNDRITNKNELPLPFIDAATPLLEIYNSEQYQNNRNCNKSVEPCSTCGHAYTGMGYSGEVYLRNNPDKKIYFRRDYYNAFYSLIDKKKSNSYYIPAIGAHELAK